MRNMSPLLTAEVAAKHGVSVRTVHRMIASGELAAQRPIPGSKSPYVFEPAEVERAFAARAAKTTKAKREDQASAA